MNDRIKNTPIIRVEVRIEPNHDGSQILWNLNAADGAKASGFAKSAADAMHDAANFVEAMLQPRSGGLLKKPELRLIDAEKLHDPHCADPRCTCTDRIKNNGVRDDK